MLDHTRWLVTVCRSTRGRAALVPILVLALALFAVACGDSAPVTDDEEDTRPISDLPTNTGVPDAVGVADSITIADDESEIRFTYPPHWEYRRVYWEDRWQYLFVHGSGQIVLTVYNSYDLTVQEALTQHAEVLEQRFDIEDIQVPLVMEARYTPNSSESADYVGGELPNDPDQQDIRFPYDLVFGKRHAMLGGRQRLGLYGEFSMHNERFMAVVEAVSNGRRTAVIAYTFDQTHFPTLKYGLNAFRNSIQFKEAPGEEDTQ